MTPASDSPRMSLALVTGAAHRLGRAIALALARQGYAIGLHYHHAEVEAGETAREIEALGVPVLRLPADLRTPAQIASLFARVADSDWPLRVLVNSAAVMPRADLRQISPEEWDATLALNLRAPLLCAQQAARLMDAHSAPGGVIVNISDSGALRPWTAFPAYMVSKAAIESLTRLLARSLAPHIRVNAVAPGLTLPSADTRPEDWERLLKRLPLKRPAAPEEIGQAVVFLLQNEYITGQTLVVDGGYQLV